MVLVDVTGKRGETKRRRKFKQIVILELVNQKVQAILDLVSVLKTPTYLFPKMKTKLNLLKLKALDLKKIKENKI